MLSSIIKALKSEPVAVTGAVQALVALLVSLGLHLSTDQTGAVLTVTTALLALLAAVSARPFAVSALTGLMSAVGTAAVAFGVHGISSGLVSAVNAALVAVLSLVLRGHVSPVSSPPNMVTLVAAGHAGLTQTDIEKVAGEVVGRLGSGAPSTPAEPTP